MAASRPMAEGLAAQLAQARTYQKAVNDLARGAPGGRLTELSAQFDAWVKSVEQMVFLPVPPDMPLISPV